MEMEEEFKSRVVGVDLSSDRTTYAIVDIRGRIVATSHFETDKYPDINDYVSKLTDDIVNLVEANGGYGSIRSVGISVPSACDISGIMVSPPNLPWKGNIPLAAMLRDRMGLAVALGNDAYVAALGEHVYGSAHGMKDFIVVALSSGTGSCFFSDGHAHMRIGRYIDTKSASGRQLAFRFVCTLFKTLRTCLRSFELSVNRILTGQIIVSKIQLRCTGIVFLRPCRLSEPLMITVFITLNVMSRLSIILTGGISHAGKWLLEPTRESFERHIFYNMRDRVKIQVSKLDDHERDVLGASVLAWEVPEYSLFK